MSKILDADAPIATIFGGSGFIGRYVVRRLVNKGWRVRVAVRYPNQALHLKTYGEVGQVELLSCSIFNRDSVVSSISGATAVINTVAGFLNETSRKRLAEYYINGPEIIAKACENSGIKNLIHISSIGADNKAESLYSRYKAKGEEKVLEWFPNAVIFRLSLVFGNEDRFFNRYAAMSSYSIILPIIGQNTRFQPVYVDDVAKAVEKVLTEKKVKGVFEIGGPEVLTHRENIEKMLNVIRRKRVLLTLPFKLAIFMGSMFGYIKILSFGLLKPPFTVDNVKQLKVDNVVGKRAKGLENLNIKPTTLDSIIPSYLYAYRPYGQYNEVTEVSKKMNKKSP